MIYLHLSSTDSLAIHQHNTCADFTCKLPETLQLEGYWECALINLFGKNIPSIYNVFCDIIEHNVIKDRKLPILCQNLRNKPFQHFNFIKVKNQNCKRIRISITYVHLDPISASTAPVYLVLCLRKSGPTIL